MYSIRAMNMADYPEIITLMQQTPGVSIRDADSPEATSRYLERNPGLSFVALFNGKIGGCIFSGHDGRRGYLQHLVVLPRYRKQGVASALVENCLAALEALGIAKSHVDVLKDYHPGQQFWAAQGWVLRTDIDRYSCIRSNSDNA